MSEHVRVKHKIKCFLIAGIMLSAMLLLSARLYFLQIDQHSFFQEKADKQHLINLKKNAKRGRIVDRKYRDLAITIPCKTVYADPLFIKNSSKTATVLASLLKLNSTVLKEKFKVKKRFVYIKRKISKEESEKVRELNLDGIFLMDDTKRVYPGGTLLSHVLGFVNIDGQGLEGVERVYNKYLSGKPGWSLGERDGFRREVVPLRHQTVPAQDGMDLVLTIDMAIQVMVESQLEQLVDQYDPMSASIIVMEPQNGELLALANYPTFDPNHAGQYKAQSRRNRAITDVFEPGSTFKPFIVAAGLNENKIHLEDVYFCENGSYQIGRHTLHDAHSYGSLTVRRIIERSSNIGMSKIGSDIGAYQIHAYLRKLGFGKVTDVGMDAESSGILHPTKRWSKLSISAISMGQEVAVTALQLIQGYCAFANGGYLVKPKLVKKIMGQDGRIIMKDDLMEPKKVYSEEVAREISDALTGVVSETGTAPKAALNGYAIAGKTGTAQKASPSGGYAKSKYVSSFIGFLPVQNAKAVILVVVNEPKKAHYGGTVAAPYFKEIASRLVHYMEIPPDTILAKTGYNESE